MVVLPYFIMQMRCCGFPCCPHITYYLTSFYFLPFFHNELYHVCIKSIITITVINLNLVTITPGGMFGFDDNTIAGSIYGSALWC